MVWLLLITTIQEAQGGIGVFSTGHIITMVVVVVGWLVQTGAFFYRLGKHDKNIEARFDNVDSRFEKHGERLGAVERDRATNTTRIDELAKKTQQMEFQVSELYKDFGDTRSSIDNLIRTMEAQSERRRLDEREIIERLATIETQLTFLVSGQLPNNKEG